jgi:hypothetical protein
MKFRKGTTLKDRFLMGVTIPINEDDCWIWHGTISKNGYGLIRNEVSKKESAQRIAYRLYISDFDRSLSVLHHCDVRNCVNPKHLFLGTYSDNMQDMWNKHRHPKPTFGRPFITPIGERNSHNKLKEEEVLEIRRLHNKKVELEVLAKMFCVQKPAIWKIVNRYTWKHI